MFSKAAYMVALALLFFVLSPALAIIWASLWLRDQRELLV
jgi:hypothetical protein